MGLYYFRPRWSTLITAFLIASGVSLIPWMSMGEPTYGLSSILFAAYARKYAGFRINIGRVVVLNVLIGILPNINWKIHLGCFLVSYLYWRVFYYVNNKQNS